jgi:tetratricopeptide (TPR) repeat protein
MNYAGICSFYLRQTKDSLTSFENAIRCSIAFPEPVLNLAQLCGFLGKTYEQKTLLQYYVRLQTLSGGAGISTLYILSQLSLQEGDFASAAAQYQCVMDESVACGIDLPSDRFLIEFAHALNQIGDVQRAKAIFQVDPAEASEEARLVIGQTLWGEGQFDQCRDVLTGLESPEARANLGILAFMSGNESEALRQLHAARRLAPTELPITRNTVLILVAKPASVKNGCSIWLTALNYQLDHDAAYYEELSHTLQTAPDPDPLTIFALSNWKS